jgi:ribonuclease P protein component
MLKKANRIGKNKEFDRAFKLGQSFYGNFLGIKVVENGLGRIRLGVLVSNKVSKKAPIRNLIKRRIRECVRENILEAKGGKDIVVIANPTILEKTFEEIRGFIKITLKKAKL